MTTTRMNPSPDPSGDPCNWSESAYYWDLHLDAIREMFAPVTLALIEESGIGPGSRVLDVAGGTGEPSLTVAEHVGGNGTVVYTDPIAAMAQAARRHAGRFGADRIAHCQCPAESLPFPSNSFDAVVCRFGAMFFTDPVAGIGEMLRVTRPGGSVVVAVWHSSEINPFHNIVTRVLAKYVVESAPPDPDAPGAFRYAESGKLADVFRSARAEAVDQRLLAFDIHVPASVEGFWEIRLQLSDTLRTKLAELDGKSAERVAEEIKRAAREYVSNDGLRFPARVILVRGTA